MRHPRHVLEVGGGKILRRAGESGLEEGEKEGVVEEERG